MLDGLGFDVDGVSALVAAEGVEGVGFLFECTEAWPFREGFTLTLDCDLDAHPTGRVVHDDAGWVLVFEIEDGIGTLNANQSPGAPELW